MTKDLLEQARSYCAYQERCQKEVRSKLMALSFSGEDLEEAISTLIEEGLLNEERFARSYCRGKFYQKHWGKRKITLHLKQKEISDYCIRKGMEEIDQETYDKVFEQLFQKKKKELAAEKNHWIKKKKIRDYLLYKGFEPDMIYRRLNSFR